MSKAALSITSSTALASRNLSKTLNRIANAEKLERQCQRARDPEGMFKATAAKINEQANYIVLRDMAVAEARKVARGPGPGRGRRIKTNLSPARVLFPKDDPGEKTAHRWRKAFCDGKPTAVDPRKLKAALAEAAERAVRICEQRPLGTVRGTEGTGEYERYTPPQYIELVRQVLGEIDLDPASHALAQKVVKARRFFTPEDDGLAQPWDGRIFLNPPYHTKLCPLFIDKLIAEYQDKRTSAAILLVNNSTDTDWFDMAMRATASVCFTHGRIPFIDPKKSEPLNPTQGQAFLYFGIDADRFEQVFREIGHCLRRSATYCPVTS
jgi:hypothetical protein